MKKKALFVSISGLLLLVTQSFAQRFNYMLIDIQCNADATCPSGIAQDAPAKQTSAKGINARGDIVGFYIDPANHQHGFLLRDEQFSTIDVPGALAGVSGVLPTIANGINPQGEIVGQYVVPVNSDPSLLEDSPFYCPKAGDPACIKGFLYRHGKFSTVMFPSTVDADGHLHRHPGAIAQRITPEGNIYGCLHDHDLGMSMFGAVWNQSGTASLTANGGETADPMPMPMSMNNGATPGGAHLIGGLWVDMANQQHGFLVQDGVFQSYDPTSTATLTAIWDMNPSQQFVGTYRVAGEVAAKRHGFLQLPDGSVPIQLDFQIGSVTAFSTIAFGINPDGVIVGQYTLVPGGPAHAFAAVPVNH
jgi:hypothetical protein